ncbi:MAG: 23S rRNA (guanosine(2251)-2'-O)-methyltransferase RlmB, partial [Acidiferrobacterales bacterium]|nr:23S rRNA (guanosine(2251)-2'-O)-methyltransferase RlmB [Acidiferrobacterales bacterium]
MTTPPTGLIYGLHAVLAALQEDSAHVDRVWINEERQDKRSAEIARAARAAGVKLRRVPRTRLDQLVGTRHHQGVAARTRAITTRSENELEHFLAQLTETPLLLVLDSVQDPRNFGACLRCADAAGVHGLVFPRNRSAPLTASVHQAASGAAVSVPLYQVSNMSRTLDRLRAVGIWVVGAAEQAENTLFDVDLCCPLAIVIGGEGKGLRR